MAADQQPNTHTDLTFEFEARLGRTRYKLVKDLPSGQVEVKRRNADGDTVTWIPEDLLIQYAKLWVRKQAIAFMEKV